MQVTGVRLPLSLRTRLCAGVVAIVLLTTLAVATAALYFVKRNMQAAIATEQFERISAIADAVDQKFLSRRTLLKTFSDSVNTHRFDDRQRLQAFVMQHGRSLKEAFDNVAFLDTNGDLVANLNGAQQLGRVNVKDREYFVQTVATKAGVISQPYRNRLNGLAQIAVTEPVLDEQGKVVYVIAGSINLKEHNFLGELAHTKFGKTGYMFITNTDGVVVDHPLKSRILNHSDEGGADLATERAVTGYEGTFEATDRLGAHGLYAFKRIRQTNWVLGAIYPRQEAFARIEQIERLAWAGALLLTFLAGGLTFLVMRSELAPLARLHEHMQVSRAATRYVPATERPREDEIGDLSRTFDSLMLERQFAQERLQSSEKFLRDVTDNLPAVVAYFDRDQRCLFSNKAGLGMRGKAQADIGTMKIDEALPAWVHAQLVPQFAKVLAGTATRFEGTYDRSGREGFFQCHLVPDLRGAGEVVGYYLMTFDITRQKIAERGRAAGEARIRTITDNLPALVSHVDASLRYTFVNANVRALHDGVELVGRSMPAVRGPEDFAVVEPYVRRVLAGEAVTFEKMGDRSRGVGQNWYQSHFIPDRSAEGTVQGFYAMTFDITARRQLEQRLAGLARVDVLTQLPNRLALNELLPKALARARRMGDTLALMFVDIDNFKAVNDTLGHAGGDAVLVEFARRLLASVRTTDTVVRLAGDEFVVILENLGTPGLAARLAEKIVSQVGRTAFPFDGRTLDVTTSIGIALFEAGDAPVSAADVLARADVALYGAKAAGRNTYQFAVQI